MIADCEAGNLDLIITKSVSRFARNVLDCIGHVRKLAALPHPVGVLFETAEGETRCLERDSEFIYQPDCGDCDEVLRLKAAVDSLSYRLTDSRKIELRAELCYHLTLCRRQSCSAVKAVSADDEAAPKPKEGSLILYYTDEGDRIWDISKRFSSRPSDIIAENDLEGDTVSGGMMLLIPSA